jgi:Zinc finger, C3HC4 type (RING finger)
MSKSKIIAIKENIGINDFYTIEYILSKKYPKNIFKSFKKREDYIYENYTLQNVVFDMSDIGKNPIKLLKSILLHYPVGSKLPICLSHYHYQSDRNIFKENFKPLWDNIFKSKMPRRRGSYELEPGEIIGEITREERKIFPKEGSFKTALIYLLSVYPDRDHILKLTMKMLARFLGSTNIIHDVTTSLDRHKVTSHQEISMRKSLIVGEEYRRRLEYVSSVNAINFYEKNLKTVKVYITYSVLLLPTTSNSKNEKSVRSAPPSSLYSSTSLDHPVPSAPHYSLYSSTSLDHPVPSAPRSSLDSSTSLAHPVPSAPPTSDLTCSICMENEKDHTIIPCGHCYCLSCIKQFKNCPECRGSIHKYIKIFV